MVEVRREKRDDEGCTVPGVTRETERAVTGPTIYGVGVLLAPVNARSVSRDSPRYFLVMAMEALSTQRLEENQSCDLPISSEVQQMTPVQFGDCLEHDWSHQALPQAGGPPRAKGCGHRLSVSAQLLRGKTKVSHNRWLLKYAMIGSPPVPEFCLPLYYWISN